MPRRKGAIDRDVEARIVYALIPDPMQFEELCSTLKMNRTVLAQHLDRLEKSGIVVREVLKGKRAHRVRYSINPLKLEEQTDIANIVLRARSDKVLRDEKRAGKQTDYTKGFGDAFVSKSQVRSEFVKELVSMLPLDDKQEKRRLEELGPRLWSNPGFRAIDEKIKEYVTEMAQEWLKLPEDVKRAEVKTRPKKWSFNEYVGRRNALRVAAAELRLLKEFRERRFCADCLMEGHFVRLVQTEQPQDSRERITEAGCTRCHRVYDVNWPPEGMPERSVLERQKIRKKQIMKERDMEKEPVTVREELGTKESEEKLGEIMSLKREIEFEEKVLEYLREQRGPMTADQIYMGIGEKKKRIPKVFHKALTSLLRRELISKQEQHYFLR